MEVNNKMNNKVIICVLCKDIHPKLELLYKTISSSLMIKVFMISDNYTESFVVSEYNKQIYISDEESRVRGYKDINFFIKKNPSAWDKVFYFLNERYKETYDYVYIIEDDVGIYSFQRFKRLIMKYRQNKKDLLCSKLENKKNSLYWEHWNQSELYRWKEKQMNEMNLYKCFLPFCRMSHKLIDKCIEYKEINNRFCFLEIFIPTVCFLENLTMENLEELTINMNPVRYRPLYTLQELINKKKLIIYHPFKDNDIMVDLFFHNTIEFEKYNKI